MSDTSVALITGISTIAGAVVGSVITYFTTTAIENRRNERELLTLLVLAREETDLIRSYFASLHELLEHLAAKDNPRWNLIIKSIFASRTYHIQKLLKTHKYQYLLPQQLLIDTQTVLTYMRILGRQKKILFKLGDYVHDDGRASVVNYIKTTNNALNMLHQDLLDLHKSISGKRLWRVLEALADMVEDFKKLLKAFVASRNPDQGGQGPPESSDSSK